MERNAEYAFRLGEVFILLNFFIAFLEKCMPNLVDFATEKTFTMYHKRNHTDAHIKC